MQLFWSASSLKIGQSSRARPKLTSQGASEVIVLQGIFGTIPSAAQSFTTMYL